MQERKLGAVIVGTGFGVLTHLRSSWPMLTEPGVAGCFWALIGPSSGAHSGYGDAEPRGRGA